MRRLVFLLAAALAVGAAAAEQAVRLLDDGRLPTSATTLPGYRASAYLQAFGAFDRAARFVGRRREACEPRLIGSSPGSFTRPGAKQTAFVYAYCEEYAGGGTTRRYEAVAVMEGDRVVRQVDLAPLNAQGYQATGLRDINRNGLTELLLLEGGFHMGEEFSELQIVELTGAGARVLRTLEGSSGTCTSGRADSRERALVYHVRPGTKPEYFVEAYERPCTEPSQDNSLPYRQVAPRIRVGP